MPVCRWLVSFAARSGCVRVVIISRKGCPSARAVPPTRNHRRYCPSPRFATLSRAHRTGRGLRAALTPSTRSMPRREALRNDVLKGAARLRSTVEAARGEQSRETLLAELEAILQREIAAEKKTPIPCRRKRKREVLRFSWAPCEKLRGLREVAEALGCGATWTSLDDGRRGLLKAVRKLRASSETVERPPEGIRIAYLPDPVKSQGAPPERYAAAVLESLGERNVAEVRALTPDDVIRGQLTVDAFDVLLIPGALRRTPSMRSGK